MADIQPFGTSSDTKTLDGINTYGLKPIKAFGCTVVNFEVSADWASQAGKLSMTLIEDEPDGDRLAIPVIGSPYVFELHRDDDDSVIFEYVGIIESFSRTANTSTKTYAVSVTSPLRILDATQVILNGYTGLGAALEGAADFSGFGAQPFGNLNGQVLVDNDTGFYHWFNVSNIINVFGILENEDPNFRVPRDFAASTFGDFGFSAANKDGIPLVNLLWGLHMGINHLPKINSSQGQQTHGGNLLYGRQNYNLSKTFEGIPYFYDFDALGFFNQIVEILGPDYRFPGDASNINEIVKTLCNEANLEYYVYLDINKNEGFGDETLREFDPNWSQPSNCSWANLDERPFHEGGKYGGTIRIQTIAKNTFFNSDRPFSDIAYNLLGLEVPDLDQTAFTNNEGIHPGKRPGQEGYGLADNEMTFSEPLDSRGLDSESDGFTEVGTKTLSGGGNFPGGTGLFDNSKMDDIRITDSNVSLQAADAVTMKVVTGGYQSRLIHVPRELIKCYWGDIVLINSANNPRSLANWNSTTIDTVTDNVGLNKTSVRKIPIVTQILDPSDTDDFIFIDMQSIFGDYTIPRTIHQGIYAASLFEIRLAMNGFDNWFDWWATVKMGKYKSMLEFFYPSCIELDPTKTVPDSGDMKAGTHALNNASGLGYAGVSILLNCTNPMTMQDSLHENMTFGFDCSGNLKEEMPLPSGGCVAGHESDCFPTGLFLANISCAVAKKQLKKLLLPQMQEKIKQIGDTHYGKTWYVPVPFMRTKKDLDANSLVGHFTHSWECADSAYVEPTQYYGNMIPQTNLFLEDGKVKSFVNYTNEFVFPATDGNTLELLGRESFPFDDAYLKNLESPFDRQDKKVFNFSEYDFDELAMTKFYHRPKIFSAALYGAGAVGYSGEVVEKSIIHAKPESVNCEYSFLPYSYQFVYNRFLLQFSNTENGIPTVYAGESGIVAGKFGNDSGMMGAVAMNEAKNQSTTHKTNQQGVLQALRADEDGNPIPW
jgi:hypothetical protein